MHKSSDYKIFVGGKHTYETRQPTAVVNMCAHACAFVYVTSREVGEISVTRGTCVKGFVAVGSQQSSLNNRQVFWANTATVK